MEETLKKAIQAIEWYSIIEAIIQFVNKKINIGAFFTLVGAILSLVLFLSNNIQKQNIQKDTDEATLITSRFFTVFTIAYLIVYTVLINSIIIFSNGSLIEMLLTILLPFTYLIPVYIFKRITSYPTNRYVNLPIVMVVISGFEYFLEGTIFSWSWQNPSISNPNNVSSIIFGFIITCLFFALPFRFSIFVSENLFSIYD